MKCTIKQLSEELQLSRNTVAKALKNSDEVSLKTKQLVVKKAQELNYKNIDEELLSSINARSVDEPATTMDLLCFLHVHMPLIPNFGPPY